MMLGITALALPVFPMLSLPKTTDIKMANYTKRVGNSAVRMAYTDAEIAEEEAMAAEIAAQSEAESEVEAAGNE